MPRIIEYSKLLPGQQRQLIAQLATDAMKKINAEKPLSDFVDEVWRNLKLCQTELNNAKSNHERDLLIELAACDNRQRCAYLQLELLRERDRQRSFNA